MKLKKLFGIFLTLSIMLGLSQISVFAEVFATKDAAGDAKSIYVSGNPSMYPVEYYDNETESFEGIMPEVLKIISDKTGYDFVYISGGSTDKRKEAAKNKQVELISACTENFENTTLSAPVLTAEGKKVCFGFTDIADKTFADRFNAALAEIPQNEITKISVEVSENNVKNGILLYLIIIFGVILCALVAAVIFIAKKYIKLKKETEADKYTDKLTGIGNFEYFDYHYSNVVTAEMRNISYCIYIGFDAERIKKAFEEDVYVNIVKYAALTITEHLEREDFAAKVSENGFCVLHTSINKSETEKWANELINLLNKFDDRYNDETKVRFKCGIYNVKREDVQSDRGVYNAKQGFEKADYFRNNIVFLNDEAVISDADRERYGKQIASGLKNDEFKLYMQFLVDTKTGNHVKAEVLSRWEHPEKGMLRAGAYLDLVHQIGMMSEYDLYIFKRVCDILEEYHNDGIQLPLSCNITRETISDEKLIDRMSEIIKDYTFNRENLILEITEEFFINNHKIALDNVKKLKDFGFKIAIDDMGTGYSSFSSLCMFPIDIIKIDREIIVSAETEKGKKLLTGIVELAHSMDMETVCEGVETEKQDRIVKEADCDYIQGFYYSKPLPVEEAKKLI